MYVIHRQDGKSFQCSHFGKCRIKSNVHDFAHEFYQIPQPLLSIQTREGPKGYPNNGASFKQSIQAGVQ